MLRSTWRCGSCAIAALMLTAGMASAEGDTIRLGGRSGIDDSLIQRLDLKANDDADVTATHYRGGWGGYRGGWGGGYWGGYRGGWGGYRGGVSIGIGFGGYRGYGWGGYGYRGYGWGGYGYRGYGWGGYYPSYYSSYYSYPSYYSYSYPSYYSYGYSYPSYYGGYCGVGSSYAAVAPVVTLAVRPNVVMPRIQDDNVLPNPAPANPGGAFRYDGGPNAPVPMPSQQVAPKQPIERQVSIPATKKYSFAAYGEEPGAVVQPRDEGKTLLVKGLVK